MNRFGAFRPPDEAGDHRAVAGVGEDERFGAARDFDAVDLGGVRAGFTVAPLDPDAFVFATGGEDATADPAHPVADDLKLCFLRPLGLAVEELRPGVGHDPVLGVAVGVAARPHRCSTGNDARPGPGAAHDDVGELRVVRTPDRKWAAVHHPHVGPKGLHPLVRLVAHHLGEDAAAHVFEPHIAYPSRDPIQQHRAFFARAVEAQVAQLKALGAAVGAALLVASRLQ